MQGWRRKISLHSRRSRVTDWMTPDEAAQHIAELLDCPLDIARGEIMRACEDGRMLAVAKLVDHKLVVQYAMTAEKRGGEGQKILQDRGVHRRGNELALIVPAWLPKQ